MCSYLVYQTLNIIFCVIFSLLNMTHLVTQESAVLSECRVIEVFQEMAYFDVVMSQCSIHNEDTQA